MWGRIGIVVAALAGFAVPAQAQRVVTPGIGDPSRAALLDALRGEIARDLGQPVKFVVRDMRTNGDWAFLVATPQTPAGAPIDFGKTHYAEQQREGVLDGDTLYALLQRRAGKWVVVEFVIGPTDVAWLDWESKHHVTPGVIPMPADMAH